MRVVGIHLSFVLLLFNNNCFSSLSQLYFHLFSEALFAGLSDGASIVVNDE